MREKKREQDLMEMKRIQREKMQAELIKSHNFKYKIKEHNFNPALQKAAIMQSMDEREKINQYVDIRKSYKKKYSKICDDSGKPLEYYLEKAM